MDLICMAIALRQPWDASSNMGMERISLCRCIAISPCNSSGKSVITCHKMDMIMTMELFGCWKLPLKYVSYTYQKNVVEIYECQNVLTDICC